MARRKLVAGNWKMHGTGADLAEIETIAASAANFTMVDSVLCLPATLIERAARSVDGYAIGAQDVHSAAAGAHTGCVSAAMLLDCGANLTIVGHSERRAAQCERDADVAAKAQSALDAGLNVILCVGESDTDRFMERAVETVDAQLAASLPASFTAPETLSIAYEPIWAIGTGKVPSVEEIAEMHSAIRRRLLDAFGAWMESKLEPLGERFKGLKPVTLEFDREDIALRVLFEVGGEVEIVKPRSLRRKFHAQAAKIVEAATRK